MLKFDSENYMDASTAFGGPVTQDCSYLKYVLLLHRCGLTYLRDVFFSPKFSRAFMTRVGVHLELLEQECQLLNSGITLEMLSTVLGINPGNGQTKDQVSAMTDIYYSTTGPKSVIDYSDRTVKTYNGETSRASSSIRRLRRWAGDVEVESEHVKVRSEEAEVEAELEVWIGSRGEGARWLSGSNQKASSSIRRFRRWAGDVEVESEEAEVEAELEVVVDGIRRSRGVNVKLAASRSRRHRWLAASRLRSRRRHRRRSSRSAPSYHR
ncbi:hypothetical protein ACLB2K_072347 [Fragaria x ananassa]